MFTEEEEYLNLLIECLEHLDPSIVIHRMTGDGPADLLIAPLWASRKREVLNLLHHEMKNTGKLARQTVPDIRQYEKYQERGDRNGRTIYNVQADRFIYGETCKGNADKFSDFRIYT